MNLTNTKLDLTKFKLKFYMSFDAFSFPKDARIAHSLTINGQQGAISNDIKL